MWVTSQITNKSGLKLAQGWWCSSRFQAPQTLFNVRQWNMNVKTLPCFDLWCPLNLCYFQWWTSFAPKLLKVAVKDFTKKISSSWVLNELHATNKIDLWLSHQWLMFRWCNNTYSVWYSNNIQHPCTNIQTTLILLLLFMVQSIQITISSTLCNPYQSTSLWLYTRIYNQW